MYITEATIRYMSDNASLTSLGKNSKVVVLGHSAL